METDYISRKAFIEQKERQYCQNCDRRKNSKGKVVYEFGGPPCRACGIGDMLDDVEDFPAADVRPVVHCVDCIYDNNCFAQSIFEEMSRIPFDKNRFFCADGKRRDGGADDENNH